MRKRIHCLSQNHTRLVISQWFWPLVKADHHEAVLNSSCSTTNPTRQVAASNGMVLSTMEST